MLEGTGRLGLGGALGSDELLFANKLYRQWFGTAPGAHGQLVPGRSLRPVPPPGAEGDEAGTFVGLPPTTQRGPPETPESTSRAGQMAGGAPRYLSWVDGRLAQMVIATDITPRRLAEEQATQAERAQSPAA